MKNNLLKNLMYALLNEDKGFTFVGQKHRIQVAHRTHYIDLLFYHRILKRFVLTYLNREIDVNAYLDYFENHENRNGDNLPIAMFITIQNGKFAVKYRSHQMDDLSDETKYKLYLPNEESLKTHLESILQLNL
jgi:YhcG PDDEXK nuclease domain